ncbi:glycoside hydrolase family 88 protein [Enterovibrio sp. ZSDZ35]|uniref:Glycoside hydrolase family 88 protein n=1 Tax=Enterovibrio qingdaonensis TaxID=2899818 RepID=A0ABT5QJ21_9GAMM|nr:glycoside hydrolase family 88 protein [Enterovibrio sp. ZSDZ35]MDD1780981.1 glycoside hydrolase family 88 protein [Enterovibrio sp. ZSDZ35]
MLSQKIIEKLRENFIHIGAENPKIGTQDLRWEMCEDGYWVAGFYVGELWLAYMLTGDQAFRNQATMRQPFFEHLLNEPALINHDLGFLFSLSSVAEHKLTGDEKAKVLAIRAAEALRAQFQQCGEFIQAWPLTKINTENRNELAAGRMLIDSFENMALLFWAHKQTGVQSFYDVAVAHAKTAVKHLIREDGSTFHTFKFDAATQQPIRGETLQGFSDDSCWSRGQSWAIHGLSQIYRYSGDIAFLEVARKVADYAIAHLTETSLCPWDYDALVDERGVILDSSASAITCAGLAALAELDPENAERYREAANRMLASLTEHCALFDNPEAQGLLDHGAYFVKRGADRAMLPYGDYFYFEAALRLSGKHDLFW